MTVSEMFRQGFRVRTVGHGGNDNQHQFGIVNRLGHVVSRSMEMSDSRQRLAGDINRTGREDRGDVGVEAFEFEQSHLVSGQRHVGSDCACSASSAHHGNSS